jgi:hypothetical protein
MSSPVARVSSHAAPAFRASASTSISISSSRYWPATNPGTMPE